MNGCACKSLCDKCPPVAPPPPTENGRAGADEAVTSYLAAREWAIEKLAAECDRGELSSSLVAYRVEDFIKDAYAAGRARGIEEAVAKVRQYGRDNDEWGAEAIADAIAKETDRG